MSTREVACSRYGVNIVQHMCPFSKVVIILSQLLIFLVCILIVNFFV